MTTDRTISWQALDGLARARDLDGITTLLLAAPEAERRAAAKQVEAGIRAADPDLWWRADCSPTSGWALAVIGCVPTAAKAAALLGRRSLQMWNRMDPRLFLTIARARELPWIGDLGVRLAERLAARDVWFEDWRFAAALIRAGAAEPPVTEGFVRGWLNQLQRSHRTAPPLHQRMRDDPFLDRLLPAVFEIDGLGADAGTGHLSPKTGKWDATPRFPTVVADLVAEGRLDRARVLDSTMDRLVRGDRPNALRPFLMLHDALNPAVDEMARHVPGYTRLLPDAPSTVAVMAQRSLRAVDEAGRLELETLLEVSAATLLRTEKTLVKSQLSWLERVVRRVPSRAGEILETAATAFGHPALDIQERALNVIGKHADGLSPATAARLAAAAGMLPGDLPVRCAELLGAPPSVAGLRTAGPVALPALAPVAEFPPPITDVAELVEEIVLLMTEETGVRWERVLAGLVSLRSARGELEALLGRFEHQFSETVWVPQQRTTFLGEAIRSLAGDGEFAGAGLAQSGLGRRIFSAVKIVWESGRRGGRDSALKATPEGVLAARVAEVSVQLARSPVPLLLATPTRVNGSLDAAVLAQRLARAEAEGWEPWPLDLEQALLRVPRQSDPSVADRLTSPAGKQFAACLAGGGLPDPVSTRLEQRVGAKSLEPVYGRPAVTSRVLVTLEPSGTGGLRMAEQLVTLYRQPTPRFLSSDFFVETDILTMVLPHHREVSAAWALVRLAGLADQDFRGGGELLPLLAECDGPVGPAVTLALAYVLAARHEADRVAGVDAFLTFAASPATAVTVSPAFTATSPPASAVASPPASAVTSPPASAVTSPPASTGVAPGSAVSFFAAVGAELGRLCGPDSLIKLTRVVPALTDAHRAGASAAVWEVLAAALPLLLPKAPRGLPDLLELSTQVARTAGARAELPELATVAGRSGSSRLVKEAKRLHTVLTN
ncbi:DUF6493 family protein [Actinoplanes sp. GCM10030250]|uniref:DUF6493 family protein n=1 Tax=Actinoplanes sp. GCM10030250 TaxID=3273376 RepID=UPI00360B5239